MKEKNLKINHCFIQEYNANIDEGESQFQPALILKATDVDATSKLSYEIVDGNLNDLFKIDSNTGKVLYVK